MVIRPNILEAQVMHRRLVPHINQFNYAVYYLDLPLPNGKIGNWWLGFDASDLGLRQGTELSAWVINTLKDHHLPCDDVQIRLLTMPKVMGVVFNPVSFFCVYRQNVLMAVICEVHNTFGEQHLYLCIFENKGSSEACGMFKASKMFHVSPFLPRQGYYQFQFAIEAQSVQIAIDYYDDQNKLMLSTALRGHSKPLTSAALMAAFFNIPWLSIKVLFLIHWQALKLFLKRTSFYAKPLALQSQTTLAQPMRLDHSSASATPHPVDDLS
jgi:uncharacterized protein